jgi:hypothetical protein
LLSQQCITTVSLLSRRRSCYQSRPANLPTSARVETHQDQRLSPSPRPSFATERLRRHQKATVPHSSVSSGKLASTNY